MKAVICDRNKQYIVKPGSFLKIDKLKDNVGNTVMFEKILLMYDENQNLFDDENVRNKIVISKVISHFKDKKKKIIKFKRRKGYLRNIGHRQNYTLIQILSIQDK